MANCELCGKDTENTYKAIVMGGTMNVCEDCLQFGKRVKEPLSSQTSSNKIEREIQTNKTFQVRSRRFNQEEKIIDNAIPLIQKELSKQGLNMKIFAKAIGVKESTINIIMSRKIKLELSIAKKIEKFLKIKLIELDDPSKKVVNEDDEELTEKYII